MSDRLSQPRDSPSSSAATEELVHCNEIELPLDFGLRHGISKLSTGDHRREIEQGAGNGRTGDAIHRGAIGRSKGAVAVGVDPRRHASSPSRRGDVNAVATVFPQSPKSCRGPVGEHRFRTACDHRRHPVAVKGEKRMTHRVNALMHPMQPAGIDPLVDNCGM
ncbi:MAG TPA: hypothetical protein VFM51_00715 [Solirubrobacterales bacterium]|nr:hypothetical protein [Solirubrobacterales bacterium]